MDLKQQRRAEALFKKEEHRNQGPDAMADYKARAVAVRKNMARLKELRLARDAAKAGKKGTG